MKKCKVCKTKFEPRNSLQVACSMKCALEAAKTKRQQEFKAETRRRKQALKSRADWLKEAQAEFNRYIRIRDKGKPCVSCGKPDNGTHQRHASHFRSVGAASHLRFNVFNVHASCAQCNAIKSGNIVEYVVELPNRIGKNRTDWLMTANFEKRYSIDYAKRVKSIFRRKANLYRKLFRVD